MLAVNVTFVTIITLEIQKNLVDRAHLAIALIMSTLIDQEIVMQNQGNAFSACTIPMEITVNIVEMDTMVMLHGKTVEPVTATFLERNQENIVIAILVNVHAYQMLLASDVISAFRIIGKLLVVKVASHVIAMN